MGIFDFFEDYGDIIGDAALVVGGVGLAMLIDSDNNNNGHVVSQFSQLNLFCSELENVSLYIDSNIFMDERFEPLFENFKKFNLKIILLNEQYHELYHLKKSENDTKSFRARNAFRLIEELLNLKKLTIKDLDPEQTTKAYADPILIKRIIADIQNQKKVVFITEDRDLKIRLKVQMEQKSLDENLISIYDYNDLDFIHPTTKDVDEDEDPFNSIW